MPTKLITTTLVIMLLAVVLPRLSAQEIVHATAGTLTDSSRTKDSLMVQTLNQSIEVFQVKQPLSTPISFDKVLRETSETIDKLSKGKTNVIVYYFGYSPKTVVAVKDLGNKVLDISGTVTHADKRQHTLTVHSDGGSDTVCYLSSDTAVETSDGAMEGTKYSIKKGDKVTVVSTNDAGKQTAQFIQLL